MTKLSKYAVKPSIASTHAGEVVENFMGGNSYSLTPISTLKIIAASSIFGEPMYYRDGLEVPKTISNHMSLLEYSIFSAFLQDKKTAADVFTSAVDKALDFDFEKTLELAVELRKEYFMRLNPAVIFVRASIHKGRKTFNEKNPGRMREVGKLIANRPDDLTNQFEYYMFINGSKSKLPSVVKRTWAEKLQEFSRYQLNKYKGKLLVDLVRISHANNADIDDLMANKLIVEESEKTWENLRSERKTWKEIFKTIKIPHMALLRNLRGIFSETHDIEFARLVVAHLKDGVLTGKQFPFRYWSAYKAIVGATDVMHKGILTDALEECIDVSVANMPKLSGKVMCLSDNSGSAWGSFTSEMGTVSKAEIANLSSLITAQQSEEGYVGVFGDKLSVQPVSKRNGLLTQLAETSARGKQQGGGTENGIWLFWDNAIQKKEHWDTVFIYSDMQAGHGGLYGVDSTQYKKFAHKKGGMYIDVLALVEEYRKTVNPKVNVFSVQVAGYSNSVLPENIYRGALLAGWTGKEPMFANSIIQTWDEVEKVKRNR